MRHQLPAILAGVLIACASEATDPVRSSNSEHADAASSEDPASSAEGAVGDNASCGAFSEAWQTASCDSCLFSEPCDDVRNRLATECRPAYRCMERNCLCRSAGDCPSATCACIDSCLTPEPGLCHELFVELVQCVVAHCESCL